MPPAEGKPIACHIECHVHELSAVCVAVNRPKRSPAARLAINILSEFIGIRVRDRGRRVSRGQLACYSKRSIRGAREIQRTPARHSAGGTNDPAQMPKRRVRA